MRGTRPTWDALTAIRDAAMHANLPVMTDMSMKMANAYRISLARMDSIMKAAVVSPTPELVRHATANRAILLPQHGGELVLLTRPGLREQAGHRQQQLFAAIRKQQAAATSAKDRSTAMMLKTAANPTRDRNSVMQNLQILSGTTDTPAKT